MSTSSQIAKRNRDGTIASVYCHSDGYPEWNGRMLINYYNSEEKIAELISLGSISLLQPEIGTKHDFYERTCTTFYHRDRDDPWENNKPVVLSDFDTWLNWCDEDYAYLWDNGRWRIFSRWHSTREITDNAAIAMAIIGASLETATQSRGSEVQNG